MRRLATFGLLAALYAPVVRAANPLDVEMAVLAGQVRFDLASYGNAVAMGEFTGPLQLASTGGPRIAASLRAQFEKLGVVVNKQASVILRGTYRPVVDEKSGLAALQIAARLEETKTGKQLAEFRARGVFDLTEISAVTGVTMSTPASDSQPVREEKIAQALDQVQPPSVAGTRISATRKSPYALEILVGPNTGGPLDLSKYRPRAPSVGTDGLAFLKISRGEVYAIKIINDAKHDVAVTLTIDGLSVFAFSENKSYSVLFVGAGKSGVVPGWHITNNRADAFQVVGYAQSAVARELPNSSSVGTIQAVFKAAWLKDGRPPPDEPTAPEGVRAGDATARGQPIDARYNEVVPHVGRFREAVSVRYNKAGDPTNLPPSSNPAGP